jgi:hypothetical protein
VGKGLAGEAVKNLRVRFADTPPSSLTPPATAVSHTKGRALFDVNADTLTGANGRVSVSYFCHYKQTNKGETL